jgi:hypothetical protein
MKIRMTSKKFCFAVFLAVAGTLATATLGAAFGSKDFVAKAQPKPAECYRISTGTPFGDDVSASAKNDIWCYRELEEPQGARVVYNIDSKGVTRPELSMMIEADGTIVHASLAGGQLTLHRLRGAFSPIGAPLTPPHDAERVPEPITASEADSGMKMFWDYGDVMIHVARVDQGTFNASVTPDLMPWRGYWFPYSSHRLDDGDKSPFAKYDAFVSRRAAATNPGSQEWEKKNHYYHGISWSGHCNGWAAASVLSKEPKKPIKDPFSGVTFGVSDLKGLLIERHYCPKTVFYGSRADGISTNPPLAASTFHNVLTYFIGELKKPVLMDLLPTATVENTVISGYSMNITKTGNNSYYVVATLKVHTYDNQAIEEPGEAPSSAREYAYNLITSDDGQVIGGSWVTANPDFIWVPLAPGDCDEKNKVIDQFWLDEINRYGDN